MSTTVSSAEEYQALLEMSDRLPSGAAARIEAPEQVWFDVIARFPDLRYDVAHNKTVPISILRHLARDPDTRVRGKVAARRKTPPDVLAELACDPDEGVRARVAYNAKTPISVLEMLVNDPWEGASKRARERIASQIKEADS
ncbi:MAG: hypothetical protein LBG44_01105 [Gemmatimonadota bacterium]|jgi:hypothetical protein|nr:hypothetical protein [Gemmatimonadota bacterium]